MREFRWEKWHGCLSARFRCLSLGVAPTKSDADHIPTGNVSDRISAPATPGRLGWRCRAPTSSITIPITPGRATMAAPPARHAERSAHVEPAPARVGPGRRTPRRAPLQPRPGPPPPARPRPALPGHPGRRARHDPLDGVDPGRRARRAAAACARASRSAAPSGAPAPRSSSTVAVCTASAPRSTSTTCRRWRSTSRGRRRRRAQARPRRPLLDAERVIDHLVDLVRETVADLDGAGRTPSVSPSVSPASYDQTRDVLTMGPNLGWRDVPVGAILRRDARRRLPGRRRQRGQPGRQRPRPPPATPSARTSSCSSARSASVAASSPADASCEAATASPASSVT